MTAPTIPQNRQQALIGDLSGRVFGRWTVLALSSQISACGGAMWECRCACGTPRVVRALSLKQSTSRSCGCWWRETMQRVHTKHGQARSKTYKLWQAAKARCDSHPDYSGRGIAMHPEWRDSFEAFLRDMGPCPPGKQLDRIDNDKGYEPGNCRWTSRDIQMRNTRRNRWVTIEGETLCVKDWATRMGLTTALICTRVSKLGWTREEAILTPRKPLHAKGTEHPGAKLTSEQVEEIRRERKLGTPLKVLSQRFGVSVSQVSKIAMRQRFKNVV